MKKTTRTARKVLSVFLSVLMILTTLTVAAPGLVLAAGSYYVRVYLNIYDGADNGYFYDYKVVTDSDSDFYGKPNDYKWKGNIVTGSAGYKGDLNMAGFTLFYNNGNSYVTEDLKDELFAFQTNHSSNYYTDFDSNGKISLDSLASAKNYEEHVYGFTLTSLPTELFWLIDSYACTNDAAYAITKITVAANNSAEEHTIWSGYTGSESRMYCYYGSITPSGIHTCYDEGTGDTQKSYYLNYTTSTSGIWSTSLVPASVKFTDSAAINDTIPRMDADDSRSYFTRSAKVYDQFGVEMDITPTYYVTDASGKKLNSEYIYYEGGRLYVKKETQTLYPVSSDVLKPGDAKIDTYYLVADYNGITGSIQVNLTNPTYTFNYLNLENQNVLTGFYPYGTIVKSPSVRFTQYEDNDKHAIWSFPEYVTVTGDMTVKLNKTDETEAHSVPSYTVTQPATYDKEGIETGTCEKCEGIITRTIPKLNDGAAPVITVTGNSNDNKTFCGTVSVTVTDNTAVTLSVTKDGAEYTVDNTADFTLTQAGTYVITATDASNNTETTNVTVNAEHSVDTWTPVDDANHSGTCTVCGETVTAAHNFINPTLTRPSKNEAGEWVDGYYTSTCVCGDTVVAPAERADYTDYDKVVEQLEDLLNNDTITEEAKDKIKEALKDDGVSGDRIASEQEIVNNATDALEDVLAEINAGIADGSMVYVDLSAYNEALAVYNTTTAGVATTEDKAAAQAAIDSVAGINDTTTKANGNQDKIDAAVKVLADLNAKYAKCANNEHAYESVTTAPTCTEGGYTTHTCTVCGDSYKDNETPENGHTWSTEGEFTADTSVENKVGYYTYTCEVKDCDGTLVIYVEAADYNELNKLVEELEKLIEDNDLTEAAKSEIQAAIEKAEELPDDLTKPATEEGVTTPDGQGQINDLVKELSEIKTEIENGINDETAIKPDSTAAEKAVEDAEDLIDEIENLPQADKDAIADLREQLDEILKEIEADDNATAEKYQDDLDDIEEEANEIINKYADCESGNHKWGPAELTTKPSKGVKGAYTETCTVCGATRITEVDLADYDEFNVVVDQLEDLANTENLTDTAAKAIEEALAKADALDKQLPADATRADSTVINGGQQTIDNLVDELKQVVADTNTAIADGSALKPDYEAWEEAETAYDALDKTNVKDEILEEVADLKAEIAEKQENKNHTQATATQDEIDEATERLNEIIDGIIDGSLKEPADYSDWIAAENTYDAFTEEQLKNVDAETLEEVASLKNTIDALEVDPSTNADDQQTIDDAAERLNEIIAEINAILTEKPDFTEWTKAEEEYDALTEEQLEDVKSDILEEAEKLKAEIEAIENNDDATKLEYQDDINDAADRLNEIIDGINDGSLKDPDYSKVEEKLEEINKVEGLTEEAQEKIDDIEETLQEIKDKKNPEANYKDDQKFVDILEDQLDEILDAIEDGSALVPDYEAWNEAEDTYDELDKTNIQAEIIAEANALKDKIAKLEDDDTLTQATATQKDIDEATDRLNEIIDGINDGSLIKPADYTEVDEALADAKEKAENNDVTDGVKDAIKEIEDELNELKKDPTTNADDQDEIDALEKELEDIITGIDNGSLVKPDYEAWEEAETAYDNLEKTNVKNEIITEAEALKAEIAEKQADDSLTQATATQKDIDEATERLNEIITGIETGTLKKPADYTEVDKDLADAKDKAENNDVIDGVKDAIDAIEDELNELKKDPTTSADDQDEIDALEKELEKIITGIDNGSLVKPDYTDADGAIENAENGFDGGKLSDEDKAALDELKNKLDEIKNDPTSNAKDDQGAVDEIKDKVEDIVDKYSACANGNHTYKTTETAPTCTEDGYKLHVCELCGKSYKEAGVNAKGHAELTLEAKDPTCSEVGLTEGKYCGVCGEILVAQQEIAKLPHTDADDDGVCDHCHNSGLYDGCVCLCHNNHWFWHLVYLIIRIIWRVFKIHPVCACGRIHF